MLMQTAKTEIKNKSNSNSEQVRILLDSGSQRTYVTESLAKRLQLTKEREEEIKLVTFGSEKPKVVKTSQTKLNTVYPVTPNAGMFYQRGYKHLRRGNTQGKITCNSRHFHRSYF